MNADNDRETNRPGLSIRLTYLLIGGGLGAIIALLCAPKPGAELRSDIADATRRYIERPHETTEGLPATAGKHGESAREYEAYGPTGGGYGGVSPSESLDPPEGAGALAGNEDFPETGEWDG